MNAPVNPTVRVVYHERPGVILKYEPLGSAMCDVLVRFDDPGVEPACWVASHTLRFADGKKLPDRRAVRRAAASQTLRSLEAILDRFIAVDWKEPWPGAEFGKGLMGKAIVGAIDEVKKERRE